MIYPLSYAVIITGVGQAAVDEIETVGGGDLARKCLLVQGAIAADGCNCGQFAQTILRKNPTLTFPVDSSLDTREQVACGNRTMMATVMATVMRCVPGITMENGVARYPTCTAMQNAALRAELDEYAMRSAITCTLVEMKRNRQIFAFFVGGSDPIGPEGNCGGWAITYGFQLV